MFSLLGPTSKFIGMKYGKFFEYLRSNERLRIAHPFPDDGSFVDVDDFDLFTEYTSIGNLADRVCRQMLLDELELQLKVAKVGVHIPEESI